jgi:acetyl-CoA acetyltransferase
MTHGASLGGFAIKAAVERARVEPGAVEDVLMGCANAGRGHRLERGPPGGPARRVCP